MQYRLVTVNVVNLFFNTYLSLQNAKSHDEPAPEPKAERKAELATMS